MRRFTLAQSKKTNGAYGGNYDNSKQNRGQTNL